MLFGILSWMATILSEKILPLQEAHRIAAKFSLLLTYLEGHLLCIRKNLMKNCAFQYYGRLIIMGAN